MATVEKKMYTDEQITKMFINFNFNNFKIIQQKNIPFGKYISFMT